MGRLPDCRLSALRGTIGKEDSVKETQEGCLSRAINDFLNVITFKKLQAACRKDFFDKLRPPCSGRGALTRRWKELARLETIVPCRIVTKQLQCDCYWFRSRFVERAWQSSES